MQTTLIMFMLSMAIVATNAIKLYEQQYVDMQPTMWGIHKKTPKTLAGPAKTAGMTPADFIKHIDKLRGKNAGKIRKDKEAPQKEERWQCPICLVKVHETVKKCPSKDCAGVKPGSSPSGGSSGGWECAVCHDNIPSGQKCKNCDLSEAGAKAKAAELAKDPAKDRAEDRENEGAQTQGNLPTAQSGMFDSIKSMNTKTLIGIALLALAVIAFIVFQFTQDGGGGLDSVAAAGGLSPKQLGIGVLLLLGVGYFVTKKSKTGAARGIFGGALGGGSSSNGEEESGMGPLLILLVLVGGGAAYWYFCMQQDPRRGPRTRGPRRGADLL